MGKWVPFVNEPKDGYDAVEWLAKRPWSTGKVGMIGGSYVGWVQWWAASERPPHLVTIIPNVAPPDPFYNIPYEYGTFFMLGAIWWAEILESEATGSIDGAAMERIGEKRYSELLKSLPVIELDKKVLGKKNAYWREWIAHPSEDAYWKRASFHHKLKKVTIPVFHQSGWFDGDGIGSKLNYLALKRHGHKRQKLVLGPWGHTSQAHRRVGHRDFGPNAIVDLERAYLRWFDHWLKGMKNGVDKDPLVSLFVMGSNVWLHGDTYPLEGTRLEKWYFGASSPANAWKGGGTLSRDIPPARSRPDRYLYDPADPTPDTRYWEKPKHEKGATLSRKALQKSQRQHHQKVLEKRRDILVYRSPVFQKPYTFAGPLSAVIYAASSARDTDWFVTLSQIDEKGEMFTLAKGKLRARFRESMSKPKLLKPGRVYKYTLDLWQTGITFKKGTRLLVEVASASFPTFSRNLNTGKHNETTTKTKKARNTLYHSAKYPSHLLLPAIPKAVFKKAIKKPNLKKQPEK